MVDGLSALEAVTDAAATDDPVGPAEDPLVSLLPALKIKLLSPQAKTPCYATDGAAGLDVAALESCTLEPGSWVKARTGLALEIPPGYEGQIRPRSGLAVKRGVTVLNAPGTIDSDYRGELMVALINHGCESVTLSAGDRIAQLIVCPVTRVDVSVVAELESTSRGSGGFGSTGR